MKIDPQRLLDDLNSLRAFGATGAGVVRPAFSEVDMRSRRWLMQRMQDAGLRAHVDGVGNVFGLSRGSAPGVLIGSHTDTQPEGGWLDGAMGVIYGLEIARATHETYGSRYAVDTVSWMDEEGRFLTCLGSRSFCGELAPEDFDTAVDAQGIPLRRAVEDAGLGNIPPHRLDSRRYAGYLEAHIEQGCVLEQLHKSIGVVTAIVGGALFRITARGQQNHAGTTPMSMRRDAGMALIKLATRIDAEFRRCATSQTVWTIGSIAFAPGALNTVPGKAECTLEFRDTDGAVVERLIEILQQAAQEHGAAGVRIDVQPLGDPISPALMDHRLQRYLTQAAEGRAAGRWISMPSGAGHDAGVLANHMPSAMLFVPSIDGISHSFAEDTRADDIVLGCQVLADATQLILDSAA